jgi:hypothetical protein
MNSRLASERLGIVSRREFAATAAYVLLLSLVVTALACAVPGRRSSSTMPGGAGPAEGAAAPGTLSRAEFLAATAEDELDCGAEGEGRSHSGARTTSPLWEADTFSLPDSLTRAQFVAATQEDLNREAGDEMEERNAAPSKPLPKSKGTVHYLIEPAAQGQDFQITLQDSWISTQRNRVAVTANFDPDGKSAVHAIKQGGDDGDVHIGGMSADIGLPLVVEVMNAKGNSVLTQVQDAIDNDTVVKVSGAWRLWCEHPGVPQVQFDTTPEGPPSNPDHVFEIHPASDWGQQDLRSTFKPISSGGNDYQAYDAKKAFTYYESVPCHLQHDDSAHTTTILTPQARYNYAQFWITPDEDQGLSTGDGYILRCSVLDEAGTKVTGNRRMVFVKGTSVHAAAKQLTSGQKLHVLGLPRINLAVIRWRTLNATQRPEVLTWNLPYEMICVAKLDN